MQFIDERVDVINKGEGIDCEFEKEARVFEFRFIDFLILQKVLIHQY